MRDLDELSGSMTDRSVVKRRSKEDSVEGKKIYPRRHTRETLAQRLLAVLACLLKTATSLDNLSEVGLWLAIGLLLLIGMLRLRTVKRHLLKRERNLGRAGLLALTLTLRAALPVVSVTLADVVVCETCYETEDEECRKDRCEDCCKHCRAH